MTDSQRRRIASALGVDPLDPYVVPAWRPTVGAAVVFLSVLGMLVCLALSCVGCAATPIDVATTAANAAATTGDRAAALLHNVCTVPYREAKTHEQVAKLDTFCPDLANALDAYRAAHLAIVAAIQAAQVAGGEPDAGRLAMLTADLVRAGERLANALAAVGGAKS